MSHAPVIPGLFDVPTVAQTNAERDRAVQRVAQHAEEHAPGFQERAETFVLAYLDHHGPTAGEVLTLACKAAGIVPHDDRAFGPVYLALSRRKQIEACGFVRRERGHGTAGGNIWKLKGE
jgi:hypothetical protein